MTEEFVAFNPVLAKADDAVSKWVSQRKYCIPNATLDDAAKEMDLFRDQLTLYFSVVKNTQFLRWRKELRICDAQKLLLEHPDLSVSVVGCLVGITDKSDFRRQFFEVVGCSPKEWKRLNGL